MQHDSLPLFDWQPQCDVLLFPLHRRVGKVRRTAQLLTSKRGDAATLYWRQVISSIRRQLSRTGTPAAVIEAEIRSFFDAVQTEMTKRSYEDNYDGTD